MRAHHRNRLEDVERHNDGNERHKKLAELSDELELALIETERDLVNNLYRADELKDEGRRRIERELDLREALLRESARDGVTISRLRRKPDRERAPIRRAANHTNDRVPRRCGRTGGSSRSTG